MAENFLYYGDNLDVLRRLLKDETVDLVFLDAPFNSTVNYTVLFAEHGECRRDLVDLLDAFVRAGWPGARQLTYRLSNIF
jgi:site-specific DNA-methyltransferase (adenine-specific)